jgi:hypothetical protein
MGVTMPRGLVTIGSPSKREIFINGQYAVPAGVSPGPFLVEFGPNTFETLDEKQRIDNRETVVTDHDHPNETIDLKPVTPPEPTTGGD